MTVPRDAAGESGLVSVLIPTYKHADTVRETLESVFAQTYPNVEVIVVNDGSPDDTEAVLRPLAEAGRIRYVAQANTGQAGARNRAIAEARGEYVALLDDDDLWPPDKLEWQANALATRPETVLVYGYYQTFGQVEGAGRFENNLSGDVRRSSRRQAFIGTPGQTLIRASALRRVGGFDPDLWGIDDWDLYIRLAGVGPILYEDRLALRYRVHAGNASKNIPQMYANARRLRDKHFGTPPRPDDWADWLAMGRWIRRHYARELLRSADVNRQAGRADDARRDLARAVATDPAFALTPEFLRGMIRRVLFPRPAPAADGGK
jgi:glycosyltransferase involved in cell wall biosynthesis